MAVATCPSCGFGIPFSNPPGTTTTATARLAWFVMSSRSNGRRLLRINECGVLGRDTVWLPRAERSDSAVCASRTDDSSYTKTVVSVVVCVENRFCEPETRVRPMLEERLLVWQFNRGRTEALCRIYDRYKHDLVTLAAALLTDRSQAEDVVHDVFVGFLNSAGRFRLTGSLKGFLATCVANRARNRNRAKQEHTYDPDCSLEPPAPDGERPDLAAIFGEELRHLGGSLARLPYEQREVVLLHLHSGMRFRAIAQLQGVSVNTVQGRYRYGLDKLRTLLNGQRNV